MAEIDDPGHGYLRKAHFFLDRVREAEGAESIDQFIAGAYLEASIVFGKGAQDWMADTRGGREKADRQAWLKSTPLWKDALCEYFADVRNLVVHKDGSVEVVSRTSAVGYVLSGIAVASGSIVTGTLSPSNPTPWQRVQMRKEAQIAKKNVARLRKREAARVRRIIAQHREENERRAKALADRPTHVTRLHFKSDDELIDGRPAVDVVADYIDRLERVLRTE